MNVAPNDRPRRTGSMGAIRLGSPRLLFDPTSDEAENWPLVNPYTPLFSRIYAMRMLRRIAWHICPRPIESESPSPDTPMYSRSRFAADAPVTIAGMRP